MLAHGVGTRADLPLPVLYVVVGGGIVVLASFAALGLLWRTPRLVGTAAGVPVPGVLARVVDGRALDLLLRAVVLALSAFVLLVAWTGPDSVATNLAPWVLYVTFWVGLIPVSLLLGPVWARLNPLRTLYRWLHLPRLTSWDPTGLGRYPAAVTLLAFTWMELAAPDRSAPTHVAVFLTAYAAVQLVGALLYGEGWFERGDGFATYSRLLGRLAPLGRREDGALVWRSPLNGAAGLVSVVGTWAVVVVLVGSTAFDGVTRTQVWQNSRFGISSSSLVPLAGLALSVLAVGVLYVGGAALSGRLAQRPGAVEAYAHTLIPIAAGYAIAHYFSLLLLDGQTTWILASDPFGTGANLFGTAGKVVDYSVLTPRVISVVQVVAIVAAHIVALVLAHDRALQLDGASPYRPAWQSQLPLLVVMVLLTSGGLALLLGT